MAAPYTKKQLTDVEDSAPKFGFEGIQEARFANDDLDVEQTGLAFHRLLAGRRQGFGHKHDEHEEIYVVLSGTGRLKLDDEVIEVGPLDAIRVGPGVVRQFEAGQDGLEYLVAGALSGEDFELFHDWWNGDE